MSSQSLQSLNLESMFKQGISADEAFKKVKFPTVQDLLNHHLAEKNTTIANIFSQGLGFSQTLCYDIFSGKRTAQRDHIIKIALALELNKDEINQLLKRAGHATLSPSNKDDYVILGCLVEKLKLPDIKVELKKQGCKLTFNEKDDEYANAEATKSDQKPEAK